MRLTEEQIKEYEKLKEQKQKQLARQNEYVRAKYDRIGITVPKGRKSEIEKYFRDKGYANMTEYIISLIDRDMEPIKTPQTLEFMRF